MRFLSSLLVFGISVAACAADGWQLHPDAVVRPENPHGTVTQMPPFASTTFPKTTREWSVYVPAQYKPDGTAAVMIFQDGHDYAKLDGEWRTPTVLDNLIASGEMPVTVAVFIDPGTSTEKPKPGNAWQNSNRSFEYDSLGGRYSQFLLEEILPAVEKQWPLSHDPEMRAICGASSGGICSFTVAWERPEAFRKVLSTIGSFTNIRGGNLYPSEIRKTERKPIRVFLQDSSGDLDNIAGNWPLANQQLAAALKYMGYDVKFDYTEGYGHNSERGGSIFPDALRWLWRAESTLPATSTKGDLRGDLTLLNLLIPGEGWQEVITDSAGLKGPIQFADGLCPEAGGGLLFGDIVTGAIYRVKEDGSVEKVTDDKGSGMKFGPKGVLYTCICGQSRVSGIDLASGKVVADYPQIEANDLAMTAAGNAYITETGAGQVRRIALGDGGVAGEVSVVAKGIAGPNGIGLSPDGGTLAVSEFNGGNVWAYRVDADGGLSAGEPYMTLRRPIDLSGEFRRGEPPPYKKASGGDGLCTDAEGRYYVTSALGVQIFDPTGRLCGVLPPPQAGKQVTSCAFAGPGRAWLYVANGDRLYRRKLQATGVPGFLEGAAGKTP